MRRTRWQIPLVALTVLVVGGSPATAAKGRVQQATYNWDVSQGGSLWVVDEDVAIASAETLEFKTTRADHMIDLDVMDDAAQSVSAAVWQDEGPTIWFCNEIASVPITGGRPVYVKLITDVMPAAGSGCATPEMPTTGTVTARFPAASMMKGHHHHH
jgi:hypothetical protein